MTSTDKANTNGKYHQSDNKKHDALIVLVHNLGGVPEQFKYHVEFLNQNGFDVYTYPFFLSGKEHWKDFFPMMKKNKLGIVETWADELEQQLNKLSGNKIIFSFSYPSLSALLVASNRNDVKALICDGGPFSHLIAASWRFFTYHLQPDNIFLKLYLSGKMYFAFYDKFAWKRVKTLDLPHHFPILSLQGEKDQLIPPVFINDFFQKIKNIKLIVCRLPDSSHLEGLKRDRELYIKTVLNFLKKY